jgi:hypothetical protein
MSEQQETWIIIGFLNGMAGVRGSNLARMTLDTLRSPNMTCTNSAPRFGRAWMSYQHCEMPTLEVCWCKSTD